MNKLVTFFFPSLAMAAACFALALHIDRNREACPFVCRIDANGIKGAWYETQIPGLGQKTLWVSPEQKKLEGDRP